MSSGHAPPFDYDNLRRTLAARLPDATGSMEVTGISGGQSNPTFFVRFEGGGDFVLRKQPPGELLPSAHAIDREYRILRSLSDSPVPVPQALIYCEDRTVIGTPFYIMQRCEGRIFHEAAMPGLSPAERRAIYDSMNDTLVALHQIDWQERGLADFGRPGNYFSRQIARWTRQYQTARVRDVPEIETLITWLPDNIPPGDETTIAHGDFRPGNLIIHPTEPRVVAVLDWELSTLGHPLADLGYNCISWHTLPEQYGGIRGLDLPSLGIPALEDYVARYFQGVGRENSLLPFHVAFSLFRLAVIFEGIAGRAAQGNANSDSAAEVSALGQIYAARACSLLGLR
jgi:aminoglycoside phosphotransferase (APT) family kinase protein